MTLQETIDLRARSLAWEEQTGFDSIATIERIYDRTPTGAYKCCWPKCKIVRKDATKLWRHVHQGHGWTNSLPPDTPL